MSKLKLTYFDFAGSRGEDCRLALSIAGVEFEDNRISFEQWREMKSSTPFGGLPILEEDGGPALSQTTAILGMIGRRHGLLPLDDDWECARLEALGCACEDVRSAVSKTFGIDDPEELKKARTGLVEKSLLPWARNMEAQLVGPFAGGENLTIPDIKIFVMVGWIRKGILDHVPMDALDEFPKLNAVFEGVKSHPRVVDWYAKGS